MIDPLNQLETELAAMRPRGLEAQWSAQIDASLAKEKRADRRLIGAMCLGGAAACVIVVMLSSSASMVQTVSPTMASTSAAPSAGSEIQSLAAAEDFRGWK